MNPLKQKVEEVVSEEGADGQRKWSSVIVTGTSGIGKAFFGFYLAHVLVNAWKVVAYNCRNGLRVVLGPPLSEFVSMDAGDERRVLFDLLQEYQDIDKKMGTLVEGYTAGEKGSPLYLIYVTESADNWSYHTYTTEKNKSCERGNMPRRLDEIQQFALVFR